MTTSSHDAMRLLFVCTGNTCRSPLAAVIARRALAARGLGQVTVASAGTGAWADAPASDGALLVALEHGLDLNSHRAQPLSAGLVAESDLVLTMGSSHLERVESLGGGGRAWLLGDYATGSSRTVSDPFGGDLAVYRETFDELEELIGAALDRLQREHPPASA